MPILTGQNAIVRTAAVEIKTMHIGNKQVTLAVFRQLKDEDIIDVQTGQLKGVPWGTVNYFWGECKEGTHLHVVWQKGTDLRRCCLPAKREDTPEGTRTHGALQQAADRIRSAARLALAVSIGCYPVEAATKRAQWDKEQTVVYYLPDPEQGAIQIEWGPQLRKPFAPPTSLAALSEAYNLLHSPWGTPRDIADTHPLWVAATTAATQWQMTLPASKSHWEEAFLRQAGAFWAGWYARKQHWDAIATAWRQHYAAIATLDQLFIAV